MELKKKIDQGSILTAPQLPTFSSGASETNGGSSELRGMQALPPPVQFLSLPTAREGNVFTGVCLSTVSLMTTWPLLILVTARSVHILLECFLVTVRNEVAKVMFLHLSVCPQWVGGGVPGTRGVPCPGCAWSAGSAPGGCLVWGVSTPGGA